MHIAFKEIPFWLEMYSSLLFHVTMTYDLEKGHILSPVANFVGVHIETQLLITNNLSDLLIAFVHLPRRSRSQFVLHG